MHSNYWRINSITDLLYKIPKYRRCYNYPRDLDKNRYKLYIVLKRNIEPDEDYFSGYVESNNIKAIKRCYKINNNMLDNLQKFAELLYKILVEKINDYYFIIVDEEENIKESGINIKNIFTATYTMNTYLYYSLFRVAIIAYNNNFKFKIYSSIYDDKLKSLLENKNSNIKEIENYDYIELGTEEQKEYYYNNIIPDLNNSLDEIKTNDLLYLIIELMLNLSDYYRMSKYKKYKHLLRQIIDLIP